VTASRLDDGHIRQFAAASGDANPLHVDPEFARRTMYGRCVAHGALVAIVMLGAVEEAMLGQARSLDLRFAQPVFPGDDLTLRSGPHHPGRVAVEAWSRGQLSAQIMVESGDSVLPPVPPWPMAGRSEPRRVTLADLEATPGADYGDEYAPDVAGLRELAAQLGAVGIPDALLAWLAAASYTVGMLVPGADAVFVAARIARSDVPGPARIEAFTGARQRATGLLEVRARFGYGAASADLRLRAFVRPGVPGPSRDVLLGHLPPSAALSERHALVVGASRGLGASVAGALATQGATVWAGYARSGGSAEVLRQEFGAERIRPVRFDATDAEDTRAAIARITRAAGSLDGVALCAAPPPLALPLHRDAVPTALAYLTQSMAMTLYPLGEVLPHIAPGGWLALVSSSAVADPPASWPHYVAAKGAVEALAGYCRRHFGLRVATIRPPRMRTDMTNGPTSAIGAVAPEAVAAAIVGWVLDNRPGEEILTPDWLTAKALR
jgi:NAD(P)-dependent dehydrogenase (short-subunit alcohol dehydrogenase family)/acyl dehydratase